MPEKAFTWFHVPDNAKIEASYRKTETGTELYQLHINIEHAEWNVVLPTTQAALVVNTLSHLLKV